MEEIFNLLLTWKHRKDPLAVLLMMYLIAHAAREDDEVLKRGQVVAGRPKLQKVLSASGWMARKTVDKLVKDGKITTDSTSCKGIITVCDFDKYVPPLENYRQHNRQVYNYVKCGKQVHDKVDLLLSRPEFTEKKGLLKFVIPINQGGCREPQVCFENEVGVEVRAGVEVVRIERGL